MKINRINSKFQLSRFFQFNQISIVTGLFLLIAGCNSGVEDSTSTGATNNKVPSGIFVNSGTRAVSLSWNGVNGASKYTIYWSNSSGVSKFSGAVETSTIPFFEHSSLANGMKYYYVVTAHTGSGEGPDSVQVIGEPQAAPPQTPSGLRVKEEDGRTTLNWDVVPGATNFILYWSLSSGVTENDHRIDGVVAPFVHSGLNNGQRVYYVLAAENAAGKSSNSAEISARPHPAIPTAPYVSQVTVSSGQVNLEWNSVSDAQIFDLYWNQVGNVSTADAYITQVTSPYTHLPLTDDQDYYYRLRARNSEGSSALSNEIHVTPPTAFTIGLSVAKPVMPADIGLSIAIQDGRLTLDWSQVTNASGYNLYWKSGVNGVDFIDTKIANIQPPYTHIGLSNGTSYYYRVSAINDGGESVLSSTVFGVPEIVIAGVPAGVSALAGDEQITIRWNSVEGATGYTVTVRNASQSSGFSQVVSPYTITGLVNGTSYELSVQAHENTVTSGSSALVQASPHEPPPNAPLLVSASPGDAEVLVQWSPALAQDPSDSDEVITGYKVYYSNRSGVTSSNGTVIDNVTPILGENGQWQLQHSPVINGQRYYYVVTAANIGGDSRASQEIWARPQVPIPGAPSNVWADGGDNQVTINFTEPTSDVPLGYNLYWNKTLVGGGRSADEVIPNISPGYVFQDNVNGNGTTYNFRVKAFSDGGEGIFSSEVSATPHVLPPQSAPQNVQAVAAPNQATLSWNLVIGATSYVIYWSTDSNIDPNTSPRIEGINVISGYQHLALNNGQAYYYQLAAVNAGGESALSAQVVVVPQVNPPVAAQDWGATGGDAAVTFNWTTQITVGSYTLYWHTNNTAPIEQWAQIPGVLPGHVLNGLVNDQVYYFRLSGQNPGGESPLTQIVIATPVPRLPTSPSGISTAASDSQVSLNWFTESGLTYTIHWSDNVSIAPINSGNLPIANARPIAVHSGLTNTTRYYYQIVATNSGGDSPPSAVVSAVPTLPLANVPKALSAEAGDQQVTLRWFAPDGADVTTQYTLYWSNTAGQGTAGTPVADVSSPYVHSGLSYGQDYFYVVTASSSTSTESLASNEAMAKPMLPIPATPIGFSIESGDEQNTLSWLSVEHATSYLIESATNIAMTGVLSVTEFAPVTQYVDSGLNNGTTYFYRITAQNSTDNSQPSAILSGQPQAIDNVVSPLLTGLFPDVNLQACIDTLASNVGYTYAKDVNGSLFCSGRGISTLAGMEYLINLTSLDLTTNNLGNAAVTKVRPDVPMPGAPTDASAIPGDRSITVNWTPDPSVTRYSLSFENLDSYNSTYPYTNTGPLQQYIEDPVLPYTFNNLFNDYTYRIHITAEIAGVSKTTTTILAIPKFNTDSAPTAVNATSGDSSATVSWTNTANVGATYTVRMWDEKGSEKLPAVTNAVSPQLVTGLNNGETYYVRVEQNTATSDLAPLADLTNLKILYLGWNHFTEKDLAVLTNINNLLEIGLTSNHIVDVSAIFGSVSNPRPSMTTLYLAYNYINDISGIEFFPNLTFLDTYTNNIQSIAPLQGTLPNLQTAWIGYNKFADISPLQTHTLINDLGLADARIGDSGSVVSRPHTPVSGEVVNFTATKGDAKATLSWGNAVGAISYHVFWRSLLDTNENGSLQNVVSPITINGLRNNKDYEFSVEALDAASGSTIVTAVVTPQPLAPNAPSAISAVPENGQVTLSWTNAQNAANSYSVKVIDLAAPITDNETMINTVTSPLVVPANNGVDYEFIITANYNQSPLAPLAAMSNLNVLYLRQNYVSNIDSLVSLSNLTFIDMLGNHISDISAMQSLPVLGTLNLSSNKITNVTNLIETNFPFLRSLSLSDNNISDIGTVASPTIGSMTSLTALDLSYNNAARLMAVDSLANMTFPQINLLGNDLMACAELQTLISAYPLGRVFPQTALQGINCTDYINDAPLFITDAGADLPGPLSISMNQDTGVPTDVILLAEEIDIDPINWTVPSITAKGQVTFAISDVPPQRSTVTISYIPNPGEFGTDFIVVGIDDGTGLTDSITVNVMINRSIASALADPLMTDQVLKDCITTTAAAGFPTLTHVNQITNLVCRPADPTIDPLVGSISGIQLFSNLQFLTLWNNKISDIAVLANNVPNLRVLNLRNNRITNASLAALNPTSNEFPALTTLNLENLGIECTSLPFACNNITSLQGLEGIATLTSLNIESNPVGDAGLLFLQSLTAIEYLNISRTQITTLSPLSSLQALDYLAMHNLALTDTPVLTPLSGLPVLRRIDAISSSISDLSPLSGVNTIAYLWLPSNLIGNAGISSFNPLPTEPATFVALEKLDLQGNIIDDVADLVGLIGKPLISVDLQGNLLGTVNALGGSIEALENIGQPSGPTGAPIIQLERNNSMSCDKLTALVTTNAKVTPLIAIPVTVSALPEENCTSP